MNNERTQINKDFLKKLSNDDYYKEFIAQVLSNDLIVGIDTMVAYKSSNNSSFSLK